jgi:hypothetical protein
LGFDFLNREISPKTAKAGSSTSLTTTLSSYGRRKTPQKEMKEQQQQRQQQQQLLRLIHSAVVDGIARLEDPRHRAERHRLVVDDVEYGEPATTRRQLQLCSILVDFLDNVNDSHDEVTMTELELHGIRLIQSPDGRGGGLNVLRDFLGKERYNPDKKKSLWIVVILEPHKKHRIFLTAFPTNRTVSDLTIGDVFNLPGDALGNSLSGLMQNMPQLHRLGCTFHHVSGTECIRAFQPALRANRKR